MGKSPNRSDLKLGGEIERSSWDGKNERPNRQTRVSAAMPDMGAQKKRGGGSVDASQWTGQQMLQLDAGDQSRSAN